MPCQWDCTCLWAGEKSFELSFLGEHTCLYREGKKEKEKNEEKKEEKERSRHPPSEEENNNSRMGSACQGRRTGRSRLTLHLIDTSPEMEKSWKGLTDQGWGHDTMHNAAALQRNFFSHYSVGHLGEFPCPCLPKKKQSPCLCMGTCLQGAAPAAMSSFISVMPPSLCVWYTACPLFISGTGKTCLHMLRRTPQKDSCRCLGLCLSVSTHPLCICHLTEKGKRQNTLPSLPQTFPTGMTGDTFFSIGGRGRNWQGTGVPCLAGTPACAFLIILPCTPYTLPTLSCIVPSSPK